LSPNMVGTPLGSLIAERLQRDQPSRPDRRVEAAEDGHANGGGEPAGERVSGEVGVEYTGQTRDTLEQGDHRGREPHPPRSTNQGPQEVLTEQERDEPPTSPPDGSQEPKLPVSIEEREQH